MLCRLLSEPDVAFQGIRSRSYPGERLRCPSEKDIRCISQNKCTFEMGFTTDTKRSGVSPKPRDRRKSDKRVDGNSSLSLSPHPWKKNKKNRCAANINKPSFRWRMTQGVVFPPSVVMATVPKLEMGLNPWPVSSFCFQWPQWNCSRWKWGQSTDIWMTVCLVVRHNHQLSDPVNG